VARRRSTRDLARLVGHRQPRELILVVTEGAKTEPLYFKLLKRELRAANVEVQVSHSTDGSDPLSVVRYAIDAVQRNRSIDECYCIIDRDEHTTFDEAVRMAQDYGSGSRRRKLKLIVSDPCFEYWLLLHYKMTCAPIKREGVRSPGDCASRLLKEYVPAYDKADVNIIATFLPLTDVALRNADLVAQSHTETGASDPRTDVQTVVRRFREYTRS